jgi:hypothetical protein
MIGWGLYCTVDKAHQMDQQLAIRFCIIRQEGTDIIVKFSKTLRPTDDQQYGSGIGFKNLLTTWAANKKMVIFLFLLLIMNEKLRKTS